MKELDIVLPDPRIDRKYWGKSKAEVIQELESYLYGTQINPFGVDERDVFLRPRIRAQINAILGQRKSSTLSVIERAFYFFGGTDYQKCKLDGVEFSLDQLKEMVASFPDPVSSLAKRHFRMNVRFTGYTIQEYTKPADTVIRPFWTEFQFDLKWKSQRIGQTNECLTEVWWEFQGVPVTEKAEVQIIRERGKETQ